MTDTLFNAVRATAITLGKVVSGIATGGSTTTIIDTTLRTEPDDYWNQATALIIKTDDGAAPQGEWGIVSDFVLSTNTLTMSAVSAVVEAGDIYMLIPPRFSLDTVRNAINVVLQGIKIPKRDTSLTFSSNQTEYDLPVGLYADDIRRVWWQSNTGDSNDNQWKEVRDFGIILTGTGTQDILVIPQLDTSNTIMIEYAGDHSPLYLASDQIDEVVHLDRIKFAAAEFIYANEVGWYDDFKNSGTMANFYADKADKAMRSHPIVLPPKNGKIAIYSRGERNYPGDRNPR